jgi:hypothetical protein
MIAMTAETILIKRGHTDNLKAEALKIASLYEGNVQIQIDVKQDDSVALVRITEYGL